MTHPGQPTPSVTSFTTARCLAVMLLAVGFLLLIAPFVLAGLSCSVCGGAISGRYYQFGDRDVCSPCYDSKERCGACGIPVATPGGGSTSGAVPLCERCRQKVDRCASCDKPILGRYYTAANAGDRAPRYCESCMQNRPRCSVCNLPARNLTKYTEGYICTSCESKARKCSACGDPILTRWYSFPGGDEYYCQTCYEQTPHCDLCSRPVGLTGRRLADNRLTCADCRRSSVDSIDHAIDLLAITVRFLESKLGLYVDEPFDLVLVDNREIARLCGRRQADGIQELGIFNSRLIPESPRPTILILSDLPVTAFLETVAHEYAHLWQYTVNPHLSDERLREGFAQWVAAKWLAHCQLERPLRRLADRTDDPYGTGYQMVAQWETRHGARYLFEQVISSGRQNPKEAIRNALDQPREDRTVARTGPRAVPLHRLLPAAVLEGENAFLKKAEPIDPLRLSFRPTGHSASQLSKPSAVVDSFSSAPVAKGPAGVGR